MKKILTAARMKAADQFTIGTIGVPSLVLMERAAYAMAEEVIRYGSEHFSDGKMPSVIAACGSGNNGGDGYACARILFLKGYPVTLLETADPERLSPDAASERRMCMKLAIPSVRDPEAVFSCDIIVDALFGIGLSREIREPLRSVIEAVNASSAWVLSADIASGISADTGAVLGAAVRADRTVTMQYAKPGHYLYPGRQYTGTLVTADIGITEETKAPELLLMESGDLISGIPEREASGHKGTFGKVLLIAGSPGMAGAAYLAASAALRTGAGMVRILTPEENRIVLQTLVPEAILTVYHSTDEALERLPEALSWADAVVAGPGMGNSAHTRSLVDAVLRLHEKKPAVIDADGLNCLGGDLSLLTAHSANTAVTPHILEMVRLTGVPASELKRDPVHHARAFSEKTGAVCILKDAATVISCPDGTSYINTSGNDGMATAGSGDVLAGMTGGLLARGVSVRDAGPLAVYAHGLAGDRAAELCGKSCMTARSILDGMKHLIR